MGPPIRRGVLVGDADQLYEFHRANGVEVAEENSDRAYGIRRLRRAGSEWILSFVWATPAQGGAADQNRAGGRTPTTGKAARSSPPGPGRAQTHVREQVSRGDIAAHERGRRPHTQTTVH